MKKTLELEFNEFGYNRYYQIVENVCEYFDFRDNYGDLYDGAELNLLEMELSKRICEKYTTYAPDFLPLRFAVGDICNPKYLSLVFGVDYCDAVKFCNDNRDFVENLHEQSICYWHNFLHTTEGKFDGHYAFDVQEIIEKLYKQLRNK